MRTLANFALGKAIGLLHHGAGDQPVTVVA
jgi:hypothetical protein